jgi:hypothetical protein
MMDAPSAFALWRAKAADATQHGRVHVQCWRKTYTGLVPAEMIAQPAARDAPLCERAACSTGMSLLLLGI